MTLVEEDVLEDEQFPDSITVLRELAAAWELLDERERQLATDRFFSERSMFLSGLARFQCQKARLSVNRDLDDVHQIIQEVAFASFLESMDNPSTLDRVQRSWEHWIVGQAANKINALSRIERTGGMQGVDKMMRKNAALIRMKREMAASTGIEPSNETVVDAYNEKLAARAHPGKEGHATVKDFAPPTTMSSNEHLGGDVPMADHPGGDGTSRLDPADRLLLPRFVAEHLRVSQVDAETIEYAMWWLDQFNPEHGGPELSQAEQAQMFGVTVSRLRQMHGTTKDAVAQVFVQRYGIGPAV